MQRFEIQALENGMWSVMDRQTGKPIADREGASDRTGWKPKPWLISATAC